MISRNITLNSIEEVVKFVNKMSKCSCTVELSKDFRVVNAKGELCDAFAFGGAEEQAARLREEGIVVENGKVDLKQFGMAIEK